jgi:hypothetical protein
VTRLGLAFKFGFKFLVGDSVPVIFISMDGRELEGSFQDGGLFSLSLKHEKINNQAVVTILNFILYPTC